ncbi:hypothetical protein [Janthinobacterium violaceinigrum]|uniref:DUF4410 domain-containing protein n=1 Tax=Janthinobacterium violaceinigrum TaxID=2654252 RepID=A0A6I1HPJ8_9BURK|nr:hypothetical protein [Janthinobacterium violaceinigrum]KAB8060473.1 hypothetical protein GCN75_24805 [Janthinobacterium violaceinigrum]
MRHLLSATLLVFPLLVNAQDPADATKAQPATKLESFSARTGIVIVKGYSTIGVVNGLGRVSIDVREFRDASNPKSAQYGVSFEVKESGRLERENTSFIDEDEIDSLIRGLDYISKIERNVTTLGNFEAQYKTKGDLSMTVFSGSGGEISLAVSSGRIGKASAYLKLADAEKIRTFLSEAKSVISKAKAAGK